MLVVVRKQTTMKKRKRIQEVGVVRECNAHSSDEPEPIIKTHIL